MRFPVHHLRDLFHPSGWPIQFDHLSAWQVLVLIGLLAAPVVYLGLRALNWQSPARQAVSIGLRVAVVWVLVMTLAGARWQRPHRDLEVIAVRDVSMSIANVTPDSRGYSIQSSVDQALLRAGASAQKPANDKLGAVRFDSQATVDALPQTHFHAISGAFRSVDSARATDIASAINLAMACFSGQAMKRIVLVSDGNANLGDTSAAIDAAVAAHIPIDVVPMTFRVAHEILLDRLVAPSVLRDGEVFGLDVILRSTNPRPVTGKLTISHQGLPVDLDPDQPGVQTSIPIVVNPGITAIHLTLPPTAAPGLNEFHAVFESDSPDIDTLVGNNIADAFAFVRSKGKLLLVDNVPDGKSQRLIDALSPQGSSSQPWQIDRIEPAVFPSRLIDLEPYDAIILANIPRGPSGLDDDQAKLIAQYVRDTGGGLIVIGGTDALGAGGWRPGSEFEKILPVDLDVAENRARPAGALVLVLDHSGSMAQTMPGDPSTTKQQVANESAVLAAKTLLSGDRLGVIAFDASPHWVIDVAENRDPGWAAERIRSISPAGSTSIGPALEEAYRALMQLNPEQVPARRILLMTDGQSLSHDFPALMQKISDAGIVVSTIGMGADTDKSLLGQLASRGKGSAYFVDDAKKLRQIFVHEARTLRRSLIHEPKGGVAVEREVDSLIAADILAGLSLGTPPRLSGINLTSRKPNPPAMVVLGAGNEFGDPILARWRVGLGQTTVFTGDATGRWASEWIASGQFDSFWVQLIRTVARPTVSDRFDVSTKRDCAHTTLVIESPETDESGADFYRFVGKLSPTSAVPASAAIDLHPVQTGPGRYEMAIDTEAPGNDVAALQFTTPEGQHGTVLAGTTIGASPELRDLSSNDVMLNDLAIRTGGRIIPSINDATAETLFDREGLSHSASSLPLHDILLPALMCMIVLDVAARRLAWDRIDLKHLALVGVAMVQSFTTTRKINARPTLAALKRSRAERREAPDRSLPDSRARFDAYNPYMGAGRLQVVRSGIVTARGKQVRAEPIHPFPGGGLFEAKRRAQELIKRQQEN